MTARAALVGFAVFALLACSSAEAPLREPKRTFEPLSATCKVDHVREFFCDGLLPMTTALGAPEPYSTCPAGIETPPGVHPKGDPVARFDAPRTEWARSRAKPGHACCYSWCAPLEISDPDKVLPNAGCDEPGAFRESYCMPELESGTSAPAPSPLGHCPVSIRPPEVLHFSVPKAAPLDLATTEQRRAEGQRECCYGWCSRMPASAR